MRRRLFLGLVVGLLSVSIASCQQSSTAVVPYTAMNGQKTVEGISVAEAHESTEEFFDALDWWANSTLEEREEMGTKVGDTMAQYNYISIWGEPSSGEGHLSIYIADDVQFDMSRARQVSDDLTMIDVRFQLSIDGAEPIRMTDTVFIDEGALRLDVGDDADRLLSRLATSDSLIVTVSDSSNIPIEHTFNVGPLSDAIGLIMEGK